MGQKERPGTKTREGDGSMTAGELNARTTPDARGQSNALFSALVGLTTLAVLLQGVWAGIFIQPRADDTFVGIHSIGAYVAIVLAVAATVVAVLQLRSRRDLVAASVVFTVLILIETGLGVAVESGTDGLTVIHVPLAMMIMGMAVWLPLKARKSSRSTQGFGVVVDATIPKTPC